MSNSAQTTTLPQLTNSLLADHDAQQEGTPTPGTIETCGEVERSALCDTLQRETEVACRHLIRAMVMQGKEGRGRGLLKELGGAVLMVPEVKRRKYFEEAMTDPVIKQIRDKDISGKRNQKHTHQLPPADSSVKSLSELTAIAGRVAELNGQISVLTSSMSAVDEKLPLKLAIDKRKSSLTTIIDSLREKS